MPSHLSRPLEDIVAYSNVIAGKEYTITGTLMNKETGKALQDKEGKDITASETFTAEETSGSIKLSFTIDSSILKGQTVVAFEDLLYKEIPVAIHADLEDEDQSVHFPEIGTTATDGQSKTHAGVVGKKTTITDTVAYKNLIPGKEYQIIGILMNKETGEPLMESGSSKDEEHGTAMSYARTVDASAIFTPEESDGTIDLTFTLDTTALAGKSTVVFESLYYNEIEVTTHADIKDEGQTVHYPKIGTTATDSKTRDHIAAVENETTLIDTVEYKNLIPGQEYKLQGTLMNKETRKAVEIDNKPIVAEAVFTPEKADGTVEVAFVFDATKIAGTKTVVFENLLQNDVQLTTHADIEDEGQSVEIPKLKTNATDQDTNSHTGVAGKKQKIVDKVTYSHLIPGRQYVVKGTLMDKETGKAVIVGGKPVTAEKKFTPDKPDGIVELVYELDSSTLAGKTVVVFEDLYHKDVKVYSHADIEDEDQTIYYPGIKTTATVGGAKEVKPEGNVTLVDKVEYENLDPKQKYTLKGTLYDQSTGKPLMIDGATVTAQKEFTPGKTSGSVDMSFTFSAESLNGKTIVVFEDLYLKGKLVATHSDINDAGQSVRFSDKAGKNGGGNGRGSGMSPKTGDVAKTAAASATFLLTSIGIALLSWKRKIWWFK